MHLCFNCAIEGANLDPIEGNDVNLATVTSFSGNGHRRPIQLCDDHARDHVEYGAYFKPFEESHLDSACAAHARPAYAGNSITIFQPVAGVDMFWDWGVDLEGTGADRMATLYRVRQQSRGMVPLNYQPAHTSAPVYHYHAYEVEHRMGDDAFDQIVFLLKLLNDHAIDSDDPDIALLLRLKATSLGDVYVVVH